MSDAWTDHGGQCLRAWPNDETCYTSLAERDADEACAYCEVTIRLAGLERALMPNGTERQDDRLWGALEAVKAHCLKHGFDANIELKRREA